MKSYLTLPDYATTYHKFPKWNKRVSILEEPRLLRRLMPGIEPDVAIAKRDMAINFARECRDLASTARGYATENYGDNGPVNPYPVSGGTCNHWPDGTALHILRLEQTACQWGDLARAWHAYAGKRPGSFPSTDKPVAPSQPVTVEPSLVDYLNAALPESRPDWQGKSTLIKWPTGQVLARCGEAFLLQTSKHLFATVYGLEVKTSLDRETAAADFGQACIHQAECHSLCID
jgi:hypothetical protein